MSTETINGLVSIAEYQLSRAHLFPSKESILWFVKKHRTELIAGDALLEISRRKKIEPGHFDKFVLEVGKRAAQRAAW